MKFMKIAMAATLVSALTVSSFAGSCCNAKKAKDCGPKDDKSSATVVLK